MMSVSLAGLFVAAWLQMKRTQEFY